MAKVKRLKMKKLVKLAERHYESENEMLVLDRLAGLERKIGKAWVRGKEKRYKRLCDWYDEIIEIDDIDTVACMIRANLI